MDIRTKVEYVKTHLRTITQADDADMGLRDRALRDIEAFISDERRAMGKRLDEHITKHLGASPADLAAGRG